jgi:hypothetical protein
VERWLLCLANERVLSPASITPLFNQRFIKSKKAATSNWALPALTQAQLVYAANDAYAAAAVWQALGLG